MSAEKQELAWWDNGSMLDALFDPKAPGALPDGFKRREFKKATRDLLAQHTLDDKIWYERHCSPIFEGEFVRLLTSFLRHGVSRWGDSEHAKELLRARIGLLELLSLDRMTIAMASEQARFFLKENLVQLLGVHVFMETSDSYQLAEEHPWWHKNLGLVQIMNRLEGLAQQHKNPKSEGFVRIDPLTYRGRIFHDLCYERWSDGALDPVTQLIVLFTLSRHDRTPEKLRRAHERFSREINQEVTQSLFDNRESVRVPTMLFALPQQSHLLSQFKLSIEKGMLELLQIESNTIRTPAPSTGRAWIGRSDGEHPQLEMIFADRKTAGPGAKNRTYLSLPIASSSPNEPSPSILEQLVYSLSELGLDSNTYEHIPRVCAGVFAAAHQDSSARDNMSPKLGPRLFWDTDSGARLCQIIGFDPNNHRHRKRVQSIRDLFTKIRFHHVVRQSDKNRTDILDIHAPLLHARDIQLDTTTLYRDGFSAHHTRKAFEINEMLWDLMQTDGSSPTRFMVIDERAFNLDASSSRAFNLYWVIVNRAYYSRYGKNPIDTQGNLTLKLKTLLTFAGWSIEGKRPKRTFERLKKNLDMMIEEGLLLSWECPGILSSSPSLDELIEAHVHVRINPTQLGYIDRSAPGKHLTDE